MQLALHFHLRPPVPPVGLGFNTARFKGGVGASGGRISELPEPNCIVFGDGVIILFYISDILLRNQSGSKARMVENRCQTSAFLTSVIITGGMGELREKLNHVRLRTQPLVYIWWAVRYKKIIKKSKRQAANATLTFKASLLGNRFQRWVERTVPNVKKAHRRCLTSLFQILDTLLSFDMPATHRRPVSKFASKYLEFLKIKKNNILNVWERDWSNTIEWILQVQPRIQHSRTSGGLNSVIWRD